MANSYTNEARNIMLGALPATVYVSLHDADPGQTGSNELGASVGRKEVTLESATGGSRAASPSQVTFDLSAGTTVEFVGLWDAETGGNFLASTDVTPVTLDVDNSYRVANIAADLNLECSN